MYFGTEKPHLPKEIKKPLLALMPATVDKDRTGNSSTEILSWVEGLYKLPLLPTALQTIPSSTFLVIFLTLQAHSGYPT